MKPHAEPLWLCKYKYNAVCGAFMYTCVREYFMELLPLPVSMCRDLSMNHTQISSFNSLILAGVLSRGDGRDVKVWMLAKYMYLKMMQVGWLRRLAYLKANFGIIMYWFYEEV